MRSRAGLPTHKRHLFAFPTALLLVCFCTTTCWYHHLLHLFHGGLSMRSLSHIALVLFVCLVLIFPAAAFAQESGLTSLMAAPFYFCPR